MYFLADLQLRIFFQLLIATFLGGLLGLEREYKKKEAGLRTYALVSLASCLFTITAFGSFQKLLGFSGISFDPARVINAVATGLGFIGAGIIIYRGFHIEGLTTAAGIWIAGAIGVAVGAQLYWPAIFATILTILVLAGLRLVEKKVFKKNFQIPSKEQLKSNSF